MTFWRSDDEGMATLETTLMVVILIPLLFAILEFGWLTQRWLARYAGELGGDRAELRSYVQEQLRAVGIEPSRVIVAVEPTYVAWREPIRVSLETEERVAIPFLFATTVAVRSTAVGRGEVNR
jgi:hypothetical protein